MRESCEPPLLFLVPIISSLNCLLRNTPFSIYCHFVCPYNFPEIAFITITSLFHVRSVGFFFFFCHLLPQEHSLGLGTSSLRYSLLFFLAFSLKFLLTFSGCPITDFNLSSSRPDHWLIVCLCSLSLDDVVHSVEFSFISVPITPKLINAKTNLCSSRLICSTAYLHITSYFPPPHFQHIPLPLLFYLKSLHRFLKLESLAP